MKSTILTGVVTYALLVSTLCFGQTAGKSVGQVKGEGKNTASVKYVQNFTELAKNGEIVPVEGLEQDLKQIVRVLSAATKKNPVLIDEYENKSQPLLGNLAISLLAADAPAGLRGKTVLKIDMASLFASAGNAAEVGIRFNETLKQIADSGQSDHPVCRRHRHPGAGKPGFRRCCRIEHPGSGRRRKTAGIRYRHRRNLRGEYRVRQADQRPLSKSRADRAHRLIKTALSATSSRPTFAR